MHTKMKPQRKGQLSSKEVLGNPNFVPSPRELRKKPKKEPNPSSIHSPSYCSSLSSFYTKRLYLSTQVICLARSGFSNNQMINYNNYSQYKLFLGWKRYENNCSAKLKVIVEKETCIFTTGSKNEKQAYDSLFQQYL